jgi:hypothetical protein
MSMQKTDFWRDQKAWPKDSPEMIFLARAADQIGLALFEAEWTGEECLAEPMPSIRFDDTRTLNNILATQFPQFGRKRYSGSMAPRPISPIGRPENASANLDPPDFKFTADERQCADQFIEQHNAKAALDLDRFRKMQDKFAEFALSGKLRTSYRGIAGGEFEVMPAIWWNTERIQQRFEVCRIDPTTPFAVGSSGPRSWIFVSRTDLEEAIRSIKRERAPQQEATQGGETQCQKWLEQEFSQESPDRHKPKGDFQAIAVNKFAISNNGFDRAWIKAVNAAEQLWRFKSGAKPKQRHGESKP